MLKQAAGLRNLAVVLLMTSALVCAQAASLISEELHHHSSQHCCGLCHTGPLPVLQPAAKTEVAPARFAFWFESSDDIGEPRHAPPASTDCRAPPV
jgi:hypothetical protein